MQSLRVIGLNTISTQLHWWDEPWPCDLSVINGLDPSEDQQNRSYIVTHKRKSKKITQNLSSEVQNG